MPLQEPPSARSTDEKSPKPATGLARPFMASFLDHLVRNGIVTADMAERAAALKQQSSSDRRTIIDILQDSFGVSRDQLQYQVAQFYAFRTIEVNDRTTRRMLGSEVLKLLRGLSEPLRALAMKHKILPFDASEGLHDKLIVVTPNPSDREISEVARQFPFKKFEICYVRERDWDELWRQISTEQQSKAKPMATIITEPPKFEEDQDLDPIIDREIARVQIPSLLDSVFADAVRVGASAIHFFPKEARKTEVLFRIDGALAPWYSIDDVRTEAVAASLKIRTPGLDRYERFASQEAASTKIANGRLVHFHVSVLPVALHDLPGRHELVVVRLEREPEARWTIENIGLPGKNLQVFREALNLRHGLILISGPSDSGVTTTMAAVVRGLNAPNRSAVAVEESMQFAFEGVCHIRLSHKLSYDDALMVIEQQDPDMVIMGEIRNKKEADLALRLALQGRQVLATMQTADTAGAVVRLYALGVEPYLLAQGLRLVHSQRLVRKLCEHCRQQEASDDPRLMRLGIPHKDLAIFGPVGCIECVGGYVGMVPLHETLSVTAEIRSQILAGRQPNVDALRTALRSAGGTTLLENGIQLLLDGTTSIDEVWHALV